VVFFFLFKNTSFIGLEGIMVNDSQR